MDPEASFNYPTFQLEDMGDLPGSDPDIVWYVGRSAGITDLVCGYINAPDVFDVNGVDGGSEGCEYEGGEPIQYKSWFTVDGIIVSTQTSYFGNPFIYPTPVPPVFDDLSYASWALAGYLIPALCVAIFIGAGLVGLFTRFLKHL